MSAADGESKGTTIHSSATQRSSNVAAAQAFAAKTSPP